MAYEDINNRYNKSFESTKSLLESQNKAKQTDLKNQESDINNRYAQLVDSFNRNKTEGQQNYYTQRNSTDAVNTQNAQKMNQLAQSRGWQGGELAQINLDQNTQRTNSLGAINNQENKFLSDLAFQQLNSKRDNTTALGQLTNNRNLANEQYRAGLYSAQQDNESKRLADIYAAQQSEKQQQWEAEQSALQRAFQDQQQQAQFASQKELANMENVYKNTQNTAKEQEKTDEKDAWSAYYGLNDEMKWNFVNSAEDRQNLINALGADGYTKMYKDAQERINNSTADDYIYQNPNDPYGVLADNQPVQQKSLASPSWLDRAKNWLGW